MPDRPVLILVILDFPPRIEYIVIQTYQANTALSVRLPGERAERLNDVAMETERPRSFIIRDAIGLHLGSLNKKRRTGANALINRRGYRRRSTLKAHSN